MIIVRIFLINFKHNMMVRIVYNESDLINFVINHNGFSSVTIIINQAILHNFSFYTKECLFFYQILL